MRFQKTPLEESWRSHSGSPQIPRDCDRWRYHGSPTEPLLEIPWRPVRVPKGPPVLAHGLEDDLLPAVRASLADIHSVLRPVRHLREAVERSIAITIGATIFRRPVHAFNHLHQLRLLGIEGDQGADQHVEAMDKNQVMQIFKIGPTEALAAKNLATTQYMASTLARLVADFGMHNRWGPVHHAALASELLCTGCGPRGYNAVWAKATTNTADSLNLMADRIDKNRRGARKACRKTMTVEA